MSESNIIINSMTIQAVRQDLGFYNDPFELLIKIT